MNKSGLLSSFEVLLLDMNGTFMFGHDRFEQQDFGAVYRRFDQELSSQQANLLISRAYQYLAERYPDIRYRENFPEVSNALRNVSGLVLSNNTISCLVNTFAWFEVGVVSPEYVAALHRLASGYQLGLVADIWAPGKLWEEEFRSKGIGDLFAASWYSSDYGIVKPSPKSYLTVLNKISTEFDRTPRAVVIGDSVRRDLGAAIEAGLPCILVGAEDSRAFACVESLLELVSDPF